MVRNFCSVSPDCASHEGDDFLDDIAVIILVAAGAVGGMRFPVRPGLSIQAVDREDLDLPRFDERGQHVDHPEIFELMKAAALRRKDQHRLAVVAVDLQFHVVPQDGTEPFVIFDLHEFPLLSLDEFRHFDDLVQVRRADDVTIIAQRPAEDAADRLVVADTFAERG